MTFYIKSKNMANQKVEPGKILVTATQMPKCVEHLVPFIFKWQTLGKVYNLAQWKIIEFLSVYSLCKLRNNGVEIYEKNVPSFPPVFMFQQIQF